MKNTEKLKTNNGLIRERRISKKHQKLMIRAVFVLFVGVSRRKHLSPSFREYDLANCRFIGDLRDGLVILRDNNERITRYTYLLRGIV